MKELYHYPLCPFCRTIRIYLKEKEVEYNPVVEPFWDRRKPLAEFHMQSDLPTFMEKDHTAIEGYYAIIEYIEQSSRTQTLLGSSNKDKAETRRLMVIFNSLFFADVIKLTVFEKIIKRYIDKSSPDSNIIRRGLAELDKYLRYISWLAYNRDWLSGRNFSLADITAAAHISCVDYIGSIEWEKYPAVKDWYARVKSRPSFRDILTDKIPTYPPVSHYADLDF